MTNAQRMVLYTLQQAIDAQYLAAIAARIMRQTLAMNAYIGGGTFHYAAIRWQLISAAYYTIARDMTAEYNRIRITL